MRRLAILVAACLASACAMADSIIPQATQYLLPPRALVAQCLGDSSCQVNNQVGYQAGSGATTYLSQKSGVLAYLEADSFGQIVYDQSTGYAGVGTPAQQFLPLKCEVDWPGQGYSTSDTITFSNGGTAHPTINANGGLTGCTIATLGTPSNSLGGQITTSTGFGGLMVGVPSGSGTLGVFGGYSGGALNRVTDAISSRAQVIINRTGANDAVLGMFGAIGWSGTTTNGGYTVTGSVPQGVVPGLYVTGTNIPAGAFVSSVNSPTSVSLSQAATGAGTQTLTGAGVEANTIIGNIRATLEAEVAAGKAVVLLPYEYGRPPASWNTVPSVQQQLANSIVARVQAWEERYVKLDPVANPNQINAVLLADARAQGTNPADPGGAAVANCLYSDNTHAGGLCASYEAAAIWSGLSKTYGLQTNITAVGPAALNDIFDPVSDPGGPLGWVQKFTVTAANASTALTSASSTTNLVAGELLVCPGITGGATIASVAGSTVTASVAYSSALNNGMTGTIACYAEQGSPEMQGTTGTVLTGVSGTAPTGYGISALNSSLTATSSVSARSDGQIGNEWRLVTSGTTSGAGEIYTWYMNITPSVAVLTPNQMGLVAGDVVQGWCEIAATGLTGIGNLSLSVVTSRWTAMSAQAVSSITPPTFDGWWPTPPVTLVSADLGTQMPFQLVENFPASTTVSGTLAVRHCVLKKTNTY